jgi:hypothetical protein
MKKYWKELLIILLQMFMFYIFPLFAGPTDAMGMVVLIILATFVLSLVLGAVSGTRLKYLYPVAIAVLFVPSVFIYYNSSALVHATWYFVISGVTLGVSSFIRWLVCRLSGRK